MRKKAIILTAVLAAALVTTGTPACQAQSARTDEVEFPDWGFKVGIPSPYERHTMPDKAQGEVSDVFVHGQYAYFVKVTRIPPNTLTSTAIEQAIQAEVKAGRELGESARWELYSRKKELFKGFSRLVKFDDAILARAPFLKDIIKGDTAYESLSMAVVKDEISPILSVGVWGPPDRANEIDNEAKFLAFSVVRLPDKQQDAPDNTKPPARDVKPPAPAPTPLKNGDIELAGAVSSVAESGKSLVMVVERIRMPGGGPIKLDPTRSKTVYADKLPDLRVGARILVIGRNEGVGAPIHADTLQTMHPKEPADGNSDKAPDAAHAKSDSESGE